MWPESEVDFPVWRISGKCGNLAESDGSQNFRAARSWPWEAALGSGTCVEVLTQEAALGSGTGSEALTRKRQWSQDFMQHNFKFRVGKAVRIPTAVPACAA